MEPAHWVKSQASQGRGMESGLLTTSPSCLQLPIAGCLLLVADYNCLCVDYYYWSGSCQINRDLLYCLSKNLHMQRKFREAERHVLKAIELNSSNVHVQAHLDQVQAMLFLEDHP